VLGILVGLIGCESANVSNVDGEMGGSDGGMRTAPDPGPVHGGSGGTKGTGGAPAGTACSSPTPTSRDNIPQRNCWDNAGNVGICWQGTCCTGCIMLSELTSDGGQGAQVPIGCAPGNTNQICGTSQYGLGLDGICAACDPGKTCQEQPASSPAPAGATGYACK
jgi:hypothetical protein